MKRADLKVGMYIKHLYDQDPYKVAWIGDTLFAVENKDRSYSFGYNHLLFFTSFKKENYMEKNYLVISNAKGEKQLYDVEVVKNKTVDVKYSKLDSSWNCPGESAVHLEDTGNGYRIHLNKVEIDLDYMEAEHLLIALRTANFQETIKTTYKIIEVKK